MHASGLQRFATWVQGLGLRCLRARMHNASNFGFGDLGLGSMALVL